MILTKKTVITWPDDSNWLNENLNNARLNKIDEMILANKTDGVPNDLLNSVVERFFIDEAAAQEYIDLVVAESAKENVIIISAVIEDHAE